MIYWYVRVVEKIRTKKILFLCQLAPHAIAPNPNKQRLQVEPGAPPSAPRHWPSVYRRRKQRLPLTFPCTVPTCSSGWVVLPCSHGSGVLSSRWEEGSGGKVRLIGDNWKWGHMWGHVVIGRAVIVWLKTVTNNPSDCGPLKSVKHYLTVIDRNGNQGIGNLK
jgi:hypothetical protein